MKENNIRVYHFGAKVYFPATEVARRLGFADPYHAVNIHCNQDGLIKKRVDIKHSGTGCNQEAKLIDILNVLRLCLASSSKQGRMFLKKMLTRIPHDEVVNNINIISEQ